MYKEIQIRDMRKGDINQAVNLWVRQYRLYCLEEDFPKYWTESADEIKHTIEQHIQNRTAFVAIEDDQIVGYMGFFVFYFHNEKSALCNVASHAADEHNKEKIYNTLYKHISKIWVDDNVFNHLWMIFSHDERLKAFSYDLGFGSYVVDAYSRLDKLNTIQECSYPIRLATIDDLLALQSIVDESVIYYEKEPLFLKREAVSLDKLLELIERNNIFIACNGNKIIGFMNINRATENDPETLSVVNCGLIDELGAYIKPEYRGLRLGFHLLKAIAKYCKDNAISIIHVDFETANPYANKFWRKHFTPMIHSVRRTINKDANN